MIIQLDGKCSYKYKYWGDNLNVEKLKCWQSMYCEPMKATSNQNARPWTCPVCCMSNASGMMMSCRSDSDAVVKSIVYFCDCDMHNCVSNVSYKFQQKPSAHSSPLPAIRTVLKSQTHGDRAASMFVSSAVSWFPKYYWDFCSRTFYSPDMLVNAKLTLIEQWVVKTNWILCFSILFSCFL